MDLRLIPIEDDMASKRCFCCYNQATWQIEKNYGLKDAAPHWLPIAETCNHHKPTNPVESRLASLGLTWWDFEIFVGSAIEEERDVYDTIKAVFPGYQIRYSRFRPLPLSEGEVCFCYDTACPPQSCRMTYRLSKEDEA